jgi:hypothetical protein
LKGKKTLSERATMFAKGDLKALAKSAKELAGALRDTIDVLADHERRIKLIEEKLGLAPDSEARALKRVVKEARMV